MRPSISSKFAQLSSTILPLSYHSAHLVHAYSSETMSELTPVSRTSHLRQRLNVRLTGDAGAFQIEDLALQAKPWLAKTVSNQVYLLVSHHPLTWDRS